MLRHAARIESEIVAQYARLEYLRAKAALWDARDRGDTAAEAEATAQALIPALLRAGRPVRATVRSMTHEAELRAAVEPAG